jgi:hypothetical protein
MRNVRERRLRHSKVDSRWPAIPEEAIALRIGTRNCKAVSQDLAALEMTVVKGTERSGPA